MKQISQILTKSSLDEPARVRALSDWLVAEEPNIVLLHIGTNDVCSANEDLNEVEDILVVIDDYEFTSGKAVWVILSLIVGRGCDPFLPLCPKSLETTNFNNKD